MQKKQFEIIEAQLPLVPFDGWEWSVTLTAANSIGIDHDLCHALFPKQKADVLFAFARWADNQMLQVLDKIDPQDLSIRGRIAQAIEARLESLMPYKEAERLAVGASMSFSLKKQAIKSVWATADTIWQWVGDTSQDYNRYTKRLLLSGVLTKVMLYWLDDNSDNFTDTRDFIRRELDKVVARGQSINKIKPFLDALWGLRAFKGI